MGGGNKDASNESKAIGAITGIGPNSIWGKVGGPSGAYKARKSAEAAEAERQARIAATIGRVNQIYDAPSRQAQYQDFVNALRQHYTSDATRQKQVADRNLKFSMARSGLIGGSAQVDSQRALGEEFNRGLIDADSRAQGALADLKSQDEAARLQLTQLAQSGMDATTLTSRALAGMQAGADSARAAATAKGLGDIFGNTAATYKQQQEAQARRAGYLAPLGSYYGQR